MADKQLTVAELMARAQKENPDAQPRRRRRRSLDEGGVSVAELTGSLKAVDARPAEVKHSSVPIDSSSDSSSSSDASKAAAKDESSADKEAKAKVTAEPAKSAQPEKAEKAVKTEKVSKVEKTPQPEAPAPKPKAEKKPEPAKSPAKPAAIAAKTAETPQPKAADTPKPAKTEPAAEKQKPKAEQVKSQPKDETLARSSFKAVAPQPSKTEETGPISRVVTLGDRTAEDADKPAALRTPDAATDTEITQESPVVRDEHLPEEPVYRTDELDEVEVDNSVNPIMLVLLVFAGLVVGVLMFLGFQYLWASLNPFLVGVLALAVTGGIILLVRAMKTGRDALTMTLAALAGAAMTFGPALVTAF